MEPAQGFEPRTYGLQNRRSNQLSYAGKSCHANTNRHILTVMYPYFNQLGRASILLFAIALLWLCARLAKSVFGSYFVYV